MKKIISIFVLAIVFSIGTVNLSAASSSWTGDMKANGSWYYYGFSTGNSNYVFGQLQNRDDDYSDHFDGPGNVQLKEHNGSSWDKICSKSEYLTSNYDYVKCEDSWHNTYEDFRTYGSYDYIDMGDWCNYSDYIWSRLS